jgi:hypothetical protein
MTKPNAPVFAPYLERSGHALTTHATRWLMASSVLALAACSSTPLPEWPASNSAARPPSTQTTAGTTPPTSVANVTPVVPNHHVQALPYNASVAALFPDPSERYSTPGLADGRHSFTTNSELASLLRELNQQNMAGPLRLGVLTSGSAQSGTPIYAVVATQAQAITPLALDESKRPTVMIVAGQQGTDAAATEAVLALTKELATGGLLAPLLEKINIVLVPRANPDGFERGIATTADGTDLRLDHLALKTPEARFLAKLARDYRPSMLLDAGEFAALQPTLQRFAAVRANDMGLQYGLSPNSHEFVTKAAREWMHQPAIQALSEATLRVDWAFEAAPQPANGFVMGSLEPTTLRNASSLKNVASMQLQSRGSDLGRIHVQRRVHSHVKAMTAVLQNAAQRADDLRKVHGFVTRDVASRACRSTLVVQAQPRTSQRDVTLVDANSGQLVQKTTAWTSGLEVTEPRTRNNACGYWLSANAVQATERLGMLGVNVQRVAELSSLEAETFSTADATTPATPSNMQVHRGRMEAPPGSYYVSMNQPLAFLAAAALEPDTTYSFYSSGVLSQLTDSARVVVPPQIVFEEE